MRAVIYARYSSHNQREESIEGQLRECHDFARRNDMTIVGEYIDRAISGKTDNRADFQRLMRDSERGHFEFVITYKIDRFARNRYDSAMYKARLKKNGVKVVYAKETIPDGPEGIILESVLEGYAEYYSENLSVNIKRGMTENALACKITGGNLPLGYRATPDKHFEIDPETAPVVKRIFELYDSGLTIKEIGDEMNARGIKTSRGAAFNKNSLRTMLRNEKYIGVYQYNDIRIEDGVPPIIEKELFESVQKKLIKNKKAPARSRGEVNYLLTTKLFCGHCGEPMVGESGTSRWGKKYHYYACVTRKRRKACKKEPVPKEWIEELIVRETLNLVMRDDIIEEIADGVMAYQEREADHSVLHALEGQLRETEKAIRNMLTAIEQGIITSSTRSRLMELEAQKADIEAGIVKESIATPVIERDQIIYWLERFRRGDITDEEYRRTVIDVFVNSVFLYDDNKLVITYNYSGQHNKITLKMVDAEVAKIEGAECSTLDSSPPPKEYKPNIFYLEYAFGLIVRYKSWKK